MENPGTQSSPPPSVCSVSVHLRPSPLLLRSLRRLQIPLRRSRMGLDPTERIGVGEGRRKELFWPKPNPNKTTPNKIRSNKPQKNQKRKAKKEKPKKKNQKEKPKKKRGNKIVRGNKKASGRLENTWTIREGRKEGAHTPPAPPPGGTKVPVLHRPVDSTAS